MSDIRNIYEGLFLFPQSAASDLRAAADHVHSILGRAEAEVVAFSKWDERRLAYEIDGNKRGLYFLTYFRADPERLAGIERDTNLSEQLLRSMVTRADYVPAEVIESSDARQKLEDEIKLRGEQKEGGAAGGGRPGDQRSRVTTAKDREAEEQKKQAEAAKQAAKDAADKQEAPEGDQPAETEASTASE